MGIKKSNTIPVIDDHCFLLEHTSQQDKHGGIQRAIC